jgi:hypothetical protein
MASIAISRSRIVRFALANVCSKAARLIARLAMAARVAVDPRDEVAVELRDGVAVGVMCLY